MNVSIQSLLERKGGGLFSVPATVSVTVAVNEMNARKVGAVLVMEGERLAGIFTERDVLRRVVGTGLDPGKTLVTRVMTAEVLTITPRTTVQEVLDLFTEKRFRHLPVVENDRLVGLISIGDVSRWMADQHRAEADSLRQYIAGGLST